MFGVWGAVSWCLGPRPQTQPFRNLSIGSLLQWNLAALATGDEKVLHSLLAVGVRPRLLRSGQPRRVGFAVKLRS